MFATDSKHLIVGFGITGLSIAKALTRLGVEKICAIDSRDKPPHEAEMAQLCQKMAIGSFKDSTASDLLESCDYLWISPGVPLVTPELASTIARLPAEHVGGDIELFARLVKENIIAITGTNGKSTVTTLLGSIFAQLPYDLYVGGNLGQPALELWMASEDRKEKVQEPLFILELSSFQLETTYSLQADIGALLNLSRDHLDRYRDYEHYVAAKLALIKQSSEIVIPADEPLIDAFLATELPRRGEEEIARFSLTDNAKTDYYASLERQEVVSRTGEQVSYAKTQLRGQHNLLNIVASVAIAERFGVSLRAIEAGITNYQPLAHRSVKVREIDGVTYYNDSKATNLSSTEAAILGFPERKWLILGGVTKEQDFSPLRELLQKNIAGVALIGKDYSAILPHIPESVPYFECGTLDTALVQLKALALPGEIVLFSPACASFDQFKGFEERGRIFETLVHAL